MPPEIKAALDEAHLLVYGTPKFTSNPMYKKMYEMQLLAAIASPNTPN
ncbi:MAG: hypothetical protein ACWGQW_13825 [bacterium]